MGVIQVGEDVPNAGEATFVVAQINGVPALEVDLDEHQTLVVLAEYGFEETVPPQHFFEDQVVRRRQIVQIVLRRRRLRRPRDLVPHSPSISSFFRQFYLLPLLIFKISWFHEMEGRFYLHFNWGLGVGGED